MQIKFSVLDHKLNEDFYLSKEDLFKSFFGEFYNFIKNYKSKERNGLEDLEKYNIKSVDDFYKFADWYADNKENCYGMGFAFHDYFLTVEEGGKIENQPTDTFIGYCYHNGLFKDFINFLITFFAWWRNDEHCTNFNPYNHADDFFNSNWAVLVDTCKLFYFTAETVFHWQSFRVKYAIDNIPGVILGGISRNEWLSEKINFKDGQLPKLRVAGYEFLGWFDQKNNKIDLKNNDFSENSEIIAQFKRKDFYDYWGKEFDKIPKVIEKTYTKVDPA